MKEILIINIIINVMVILILLLLILMCINESNENINEIWYINV